MQSNTAKDIQTAIETLDLFESFIDGLPRRFDSRVFFLLRNRTFSQTIWADVTGVTPQTIGNWERGYSVPTFDNRLKIQSAAITLRESYALLVGQSETRQGSLFDPIKITQQLKTSILKAAITDFEIDLNKSQIIPIPFSSDEVGQNIEELQEDQANLLDALREQADTLIEELSRAGNAVSEKLIRYLDRYRNECAKGKVNPRLLNRFGQIITRAASSEEIDASLNLIDSEALAGFTKDHMELMRLYFREALARAQEIESAIISDSFNVDDGRQFREIADLMDGVKDENGKSIVSKDVSVILRDISNEMKDTSDAIEFASSPQTKQNLRNRLVDAFKTGSVYVARFVFFGALIAATTQPAAVGYVGSIASIIALLEASSPGTIRSKYEKLREFLPILPALPEARRD